jgi:hypothetical protein
MKPEATGPGNRRTIFLDARARLKRLDNWFQYGIIPKDAGFSHNMSDTLRRGSPLERWLLNVLAPPAKGGDTIFLKLSSGAIKSSFENRT